MSPPPLFDAGIVDLQIEEFYSTFVGQFEEQGRRSDLLIRFLTFYKLICELNFEHELWVDGSFCTQESNPGDVDVLLLLDNKALLHFDDEQARQFYVLTNPIITKARYQVDIRVIDGYDMKSRDAYRDLFGSDKYDKPKGFVRVRAGR